jgi:HlyD family secretion protein
MARFPTKTTIAGAVAIVALGVAVAVYQYRPLTAVPLQSERDVIVKVFGLGTVEGRVVTKIGFKVAGTLTELAADHGDRVSAGQVLARIDAREQSARLAKASAQLLITQAAIEVATAVARKSQAQLAQRVQTSRRRQELLARQAVSVEAAEEAQLNERVAEADALVTRTEIETAKAKLDDARAQYDYDKVILSQHELRAPFDAVVVQRAKELGSVLAPGEALFTLIAPDTVWVLAYVDEARAGGIEIGQPAEIRLRSLPQQRFRGRVARIGIESDRINEERRVNVTCDDCPEAFFLGEQAEVFITTATLREALMVPETLIHGFDGMSGTIWTVEDGRLRRRPVKFGARSLDGRVQLTDGLPPGAIVPAAILPGFREGRAVRVDQGPAR